MRVDEEFLRDVGLSAMDGDERQAFLEYAQEELEVRVGEGIAEGMTEEKMDEFQKTQTTEEAREWLMKNRPDYKEVVTKTVDELKEEIRKNRLSILS